MTEIPLGGREAQLEIVQTVQEVLAEYPESSRWTVSIQGFDRLPGVFVAIEADNQSIGGWTLTRPEEVRQRLLPGIALVTRSGNA
jgi:hypothetical protein